MAKNDWKYFYSNSLKMKYAVNILTGKIMTEDKIIYSKKEVDLIIQKGKLKPGVHEIKKIFDGEIVNYRAIDKKVYIDRRGSN